MIEFSETADRKLEAYDPSMKDLISRHPPSVDVRADGTHYVNGSLFTLTDIDEVRTAAGTLYRLVYNVHHNQSGQKGRLKGKFQTDAIMGAGHGLEKGKFNSIQGFMNSSWLKRY